MFSWVGKVWYKESAEPEVLLRQPFTLPNGLQLTVECGDITTVSADAIVVGENYQFSGNGAVARLLLERGGEEYKEAREVLKFRARAEGCSAIVYTCPGGDNLSFKHVIHAVVTDQNRKPSNWSEHLCRLFCNVAKEADMREISSVATPLVGAGKAKGNQEVSLTALVHGFSTITPTVLHKVILVDFDEKQAADMAKKISRMLRQKPEPLREGEEPPSLSQRQIQVAPTTQSASSRVWSSICQKMASLVSLSEALDPPGAVVPKLGQMQSTPEAAVGGHPSALQYDDRAMFVDPNAQGLERESQGGGTSGTHHAAVNEQEDDNNDWDLVPWNGSPVDPFQANSSRNGRQTGNEERRPRRNFGGLSERTPEQNWTQQGSSDEDSSRGRGGSRGYGRPNKTRHSADTMAGRGKTTRRSQRQGTEDESGDSDEELGGETTTVEELLAEAAGEEALPSEGGSPPDENRRISNSSSSSICNDEFPDREEPGGVNKETLQETPPFLSNEDIPGPTFTAKSGGQMLWSSSTLQDRDQMAGSYTSSGTPPDTLDHGASSDEGPLRQETNSQEQSFSTSDHYSKFGSRAETSPTYADLNPLPSDMLVRETESHRNWEVSPGHSNIWSSDQSPDVNNWRNEEDAEEERKREERPRKESESSGLDSPEEDLQAAMTTEVRQGNMPEGKIVVTEKPNLQLDGYPDCGTILIEYSFPNGTQGSQHPAPGQPYKGTFRRAFLPDNEEGQRVLQLLHTAFGRKLTFQLVQNADNREWGVEFADIPHKTSLRGGPQGHGFPDPGYLQAVKKALRANGVY